MTANDVQKLFMTEAEELLTEMEDALLSLEVDAESTELINQLFDLVWNQEERRKRKKDWQPSH